MTRRLPRLALFLTVALTVVACGADTSTDHELIDADAAYDLTQFPPEGLVVLDIRTPEEFAEGHIEDALMIDFYDEDFSEQLDALDKSVPYLVYCRSGNRSAQSVSTFEGLGFAEIYELDGGIVAWAGAGLPIEGS